MKERITRLIQRWFIQEPALFQVLCSHEIAENTNMSCPVRSGKGRVEYNPDFLREMTDLGLEEALRTEAVRILLKHPYERKPDLCSQQAIAIGSNLVVGDNYRYSSFGIEKPSDFELPGGREYEWYSRKIQEILPPEGGDGDGEGQDGASGASEQSGGNGGEDGDAGSSGANSPSNLGANSSRNRDLSALWDEDELQVALINGIIEGCTEWGSLAGEFAEKLKASTKAKINWRKVFAGFRSSILTSERKLTRMRPNRRSGFDAMGSTRQFSTRILVAVDVSGSVSSQALSYFYGVINSAFKYGIETIDVIQFDCGVRTVQNLHKVMRDVTVLGRGGTSFQEPVDYAHENGYDGLVILTDGYAPAPRIPENMRCKIMWVCDCPESYETNHGWMEKIGRACTIDLR